MDRDNDPPISVCVEAKDGRNTKNNYLKEYLIAVGLVVIGAVGGLGSQGDHAVEHVVDFLQRALSGGDAVDGATLAQKWVDQFDGDNGKVTIDGKEFKVTQENGVITFSGTDTSPFKTQNGVGVQGTAMEVAIDSNKTVYYYDGSQNSGNQGYDQAWVMVEEPISDTGNLLAQAKFTVGNAADTPDVTIMPAMPAWPTCTKLRSTLSQVASFSAPAVAPSVFLLRAGRPGRHRRQGPDPPNW